MDPSHDGSLAYRICCVGGLWGFKCVEVRIRPWGPSQSEGSRLDKLGTFQNALIIPPSTPAINRVPSLERVQPLGGVLTMRTIIC